MYKNPLFSKSKEFSENKFLDILNNPQNIPNNRILFSNCEKNNKKIFIFRSSGFWQSLFHFCGISRGTKKAKNVCRTIFYFKSTAIFLFLYFWGFFIYNMMKICLFSYIYVYWIFFSFSTNSRWKLIFLLNFFFLEWREECDWNF